MAFGTHVVTPAFLAQQKDQLQQEKIRELTQQLQDATQSRDAVGDELHEGVPPAPGLHSGHSPSVAMDAGSIASISSATALENQRLREQMEQMKYQLEHAELDAQTREKQYVSPSDTLSTLTVTFYRTTDPVK